jgi:MFS family permease
MATTSRSLVSSLLAYRVKLTLAYTNTVLTALYPVQMTTVMKTRLTNSLLIGDIFGMLFFGIAADRIGRRWGIIGCTVLLVGGVILATAAHGKTVDGMLWMMVVSRL